MGNSFGVAHECLARLKHTDAEDTCSVVNGNASRNEGNNCAKIWEVNIEFRVFPEAFNQVFLKDCTNYSIHSTLFPRRRKKFEPN